MAMFKEGAMRGRGLSVAASSIVGLLALVGPATAQDKAAPGPGAPAASPAPAAPTGSTATPPAKPALPGAAAPSAPSSAPSAAPSASPAPPAAPARPPQGVGSGTQERPISQVPADAPRTATTPPVPADAGQTAKTPAADKR